MFKPLTHRPKGNGKRFAIHISSFNFPLRIWRYVYTYREWHKSLVHLDLICRFFTQTFKKKQQKRHRCKEQTFGLCGRRRGWDDLREQHWNMYITICEIDRQSRSDAWDRALRASALGWSWGMRWGGKLEGVSGWGTHVHPWLSHVNVWQKPLQYCKVISLQLKLIN